MKSFIVVGVLICLGCLISGCGGYSSSSSNYNPPQNTLTLAGNWQFTYTSSKTGSSPSTISGTLTQNGSSFSGNVTITNSCTASGAISGTLSGYALTGTLTETNPETISITGTVATNYNSANGTYQVMSATGPCAAASGDSGTWTGTRMSSGIYGGMLMSADRIPAQLTLSLNTDSSQQVSGTATFTNSACLGSMSVAGTLSGGNLELQTESGTDGSIILTGTFNDEGKTLPLIRLSLALAEPNQGPAR